MTSPSSRSRRSCRSPRRSRASPNRCPGLKRAPCPRQPDPSSGSRSFRTPGRARQESRVAAQLPQQRLDRGVPKHDPRDQRAPHRLHRVVVAPAAAGCLKRRDDLFVGQDVEHQPQLLKVRQIFDILPGKRVVFLVSPSCSSNRWVVVEQGLRAAPFTLFGQQNATPQEKHLGSGDGASPRVGRKSSNRPLRRPETRRNLRLRRGKKSLTSSGTLAHQGMPDSAHVSR